MVCAAGESILWELSEHRTDQQQCEGQVFQVSVGSKQEAVFRLSCFCLWNDLDQISDAGLQLLIQLDLVMSLRRMPKQQQERFKTWIKISASHPPAVTLTMEAHEQKGMALSHLVHTPFAADLIQSLLLLKSCDKFLLKCTYFRTVNY